MCIVTYTEKYDIMHTVRYTEKYDLMYIVTYIANMMI